MHIDTAADPSAPPAARGGGAGGHRGPAGRRPARRRWVALGCAVLAVLLLGGVVGTLVRDSGAGAPTVPTATLFDDDEGPAFASRVTDVAPVELGVRFTASVDGAVLALRFFRSDGDEVDHPASLWSTDGQLLASAVLPASDMPGWQSVELTEPVALVAGDEYVASFHTSGGYAATTGYFEQPREHSGPVELPSDDRAGSGVYRYGDSSALPVDSYRATNYWVDVEFRPGATGVAAASTRGGGSATPTATGGPSSTPAGAPDPSATTAPASTVPGRAAPGTVGFLGDRSTLTVVDGPGTAPRGTVWEDGVLLVTGTVTLDRVWVRGSIDFSGPGTLTLTDSVVEATGSAFSVVLGRDAAGTLAISDSTIAWPADVPAPSGDWGNGAVHGDSRMVLVRNDISGTPDGVQQGTGRSTFEDNWIHDLRSSSTSHNDGIQLYGGPDVVIRGNYIVLDGPQESQNAAVFLSDDGDGFEGPVVADNYLLGGGFVLRLEDGCRDAVVTGNDFGPLAGYAEVDVSPGASVAAWSDNVTSTGVVLGRP